MSDCPPGCRVNFNIFYVHNMFSVGKDKGFLMFLGHLRLNLKKKFMCEPLFSSFDGSRPDFSSV